MPLEKIVFVIPNLNQGGAERVLITLANHWAGTGLKISIITFDKGESFFTLNDDIRIWALNSTKKGILSSPLNLLKRTSEYVKYIRAIDPDIIISFMDYPNVLCLLWNFLVKRKLIISQRTHPAHGVLPPGFTKLRKLLYKRADAIVVQTNEALKIFDDIGLTLPPIKAVIPNPINENCYDLHITSLKENIILAVGGLRPLKQFDILIDIFSKLNYNEWQLWIVGSGPEKQKLEDQIERLQLSHKIKIHNSEKDIKPYYQHSAIFALTSLREGYPNVLCEAMANGCACISFNSPTGPSEIITHNINGILIENGNQAEFQKQLQYLINNKEKVNSLGAEAIKIRDKLNITFISEKWHSLMQSVLQKNR